VLHTCNTIFYANRNRGAINADVAPCTHVDTITSFWLMSSAIAAKKWPKSTYTLTDTALQEQRKFS
jgi:hypothetical protein